MRTKKFNAVRVGSSNCEERNAELRRNHESEELKSLIARGFTPKTARKRIKGIRQPKKVVVSLGEVMAATLTISWDEYQKRDCGLKVVMRIY